MRNDSVAPTAEAVMPDSSTSSTSSATRGCANSSVTSSATAPTPGRRPTRPAKFASSLVATMTPISVIAAVTVPPAAVTRFARSDGSVAPLATMTQVFAAAFTLLKLGPDGPAVSPPLHAATTRHTAAPIPAYRKRMGNPPLS